MTKTEYEVQKQLIEQQIEEYAYDIEIDYENLHTDEKYLENVKKQYHQLLDEWKNQEGEKENEK